MRATWALTGIAITGLLATGCVHRPGAATAWPETKSTSLSTGMPKEAQDLAPNVSANLCMSMAESLEKEGKESDALVYYEKARQLSPALNDRASRRLAILYDRHDQQAKAMAEFQELLKKHPKDSTLLNDIGYSYVNRGQWAEAETFLRRAIAADKENKRAWINLGLALSQQGKYTEGLEAFAKAVTPAEAHANLGFVLATQNGKRAEAIQAYHQALVLEPMLPVAREALARLEAAPTHQP